MDYAYINQLSSYDEFIAAVSRYAETDDIFETDDECVRKRIIKKDVMFKYIDVFVDYYRKDPIVHALFCDTQVPPPVFIYIFKRVLPYVKDRWDARTFSKLLIRVCTRTHHPHKFIDHLFECREDIILDHNTQCKILYEIMSNVEHYAVAPIRAVDYLLCRFREQGLDLNEHKYAEIYLLTSSIDLNLYHFAALFIEHGANPFLIDGGRRCIDRLPKDDWAFIRHLQ